MKGLFYTLMYYVRTIGAFIAPLLIFISGMGFGRLYLQTFGIEPTQQDSTQMLLIGLVWWSIVAGRSLAHRKKGR